MASPILSCTTIFDRKKIPSPELPEYPSYGEDSVNTLNRHYGVDRPAQILEGEEFSKPALTSAEISTEWKTFRHYLTKQPKEDMGVQLHELQGLHSLKF